LQTDYVDILSELMQEIKPKILLGREEEKVDYSKDPTSLLTKRPQVYKRNRHVEKYCKITFLLACFLPIFQCFKFILLESLKTSVSLFDSGYTRLHCTWGIWLARLHRSSWLVESWSDSLWNACRISTFFLRWTCYNMLENHKLADNICNS